MANPPRQVVETAATLATAAAAAEGQLSPLVRTGSFPTAATAAEGSREKLLSWNLSICQWDSIGNRNWRGRRRRRRRRRVRGRGTWIRGKQWFRALCPSIRRAEGPMIRAAQGESGHHGNPTSIQNLELTKYGVHGTGTIRIRTDAEKLNELTWESQLGESLHDSVIESHPGLTRAISEWYRVGSAARSGTSESRTRPTGSVQFLVKLLDFWKLEPLDAVGLLGFDIADADHVSAALDGREQFRGRDVRDRIAYLLSIRATLRSLFRNLEVENDWLREPHAMLGRQTPLSLLLGGSIEDILLVKEYVDAATGR